MRRAATLLLLALPGCSTNIYVLSNTPAFIELASTDYQPDQAVADAAQNYCRGQAPARNAVEVRRRPVLQMPDSAFGGHATLYYCR